MSQAIIFQLNYIYDLIKYIHSLYLKYNKDIQISSFKSCGYGINTIKDIIQTNYFSPFLLEIKIVNINKYDKNKIESLQDIFKYILFLPIAIITPIGRWTFVDNPHYINFNTNFSIELIKELNLKLILPSYTELNGNIKNSLFIPTKYINRTILENYEHYKKLDTRYLFYTLNELDLKKLDNNYINYFTDNIIGYEMCLYLFDKFIKKLIYSNNFDDKKNYKKEYILKGNTYFEYLKDFFIKKDIYAFNKNPQRAIFYYTYLNYFNNYDIDLRENI
jgi:hypothetical protein